MACSRSRSGALGFLVSDVEYDEVEFFGETYRVNHVEDYEWQMLEFAKAATSGADTDLLSGSAAVFDFLEAVIFADDWARFRASAKRNRAQVTRDLMPIVVAAFTQTTGRPTVRPSDSSGGPKHIKQKSGGGSSSKVIRRLEKDGRPDLALMVTLAEEGRSAVSA